MTESNFWEKNPDAVNISQEFNEANSQYLAYQEIIEKYRDTLRIIPISRIRE